MISPAKAEALKLFAEGRKRYKEMDFSGALKFFEAALKADETDGPSRVFVDRCKEYIKDPPQDGWDGVYKMKTK